MYKLIHCRDQKVFEGNMKYFKNEFLLALAETEGDINLTNIPPKAGKIIIDGLFNEVTELSIRCDLNLAGYADDDIIMYFKYFGISIYDKVFGKKVCHLHNEQNIEIECYDLLDRKEYIKNLPKDEFDNYVIDVTSTCKIFLDYIRYTYNYDDYHVKKSFFLFKGRHIYMTLNHFLNRRNIPNEFMYKDEYMM